MKAPIFAPMVFLPGNAIVSVEGASGSGKTLSGLLLAVGMAGSSGDTYVIDTEGGRATHYAHRFGDDPPKYLRLDPPYRSSRYLEAIRAAVAAGARAVLVDTASHEHEGAGGMLEYHEAELQRMAGDDVRKRESCKIAAWINPKQDRTRLVVGAFLNPPVHLVLTFRTKHVTTIAQDDRGKMKPTKEEAAIGGLAYEMTFRLRLDPDAPGRVTPIKVPECMAKAVTAGDLASFDMGARIAAAAAGGPAKPAADRAALTLPGGERMQVGPGCLGKWSAAWKAALDTRDPEVFAAFTPALCEAQGIYASNAAALAAVGEVETHARGLV